MLFFANWKLNGNLEFIENYINLLSEKIIINNDDEFVIFPSFPYLSFVKSLIETNNMQNIYIGAQNCSEYEKGSYTGEVSAQMLQDIGVKYVIIGHSERRSLFLEQDLIIYNKLKILLENNLTPILCIGEKDISSFEDQISKQCMYLENSVFDSEKVILAYEPVWAIGTGKTASISHIENVSLLVKKIFKKNMRFVYGGSVNINNAKELMCISNISGLLIGNASLSVDNIYHILSM